MRSGGPRDRDTHHITEWKSPSMSENNRGEEMLRRYRKRDSASGGLRSKSSIGRTNIGRATASRPPRRLQGNSPCGDTFYAGGSCE